ncbi:MAG: UDP-2,3-diacylglucosamine diphosphatase [Gammaproteobacteria bacterium SHHR-1]|uniref:UDP-2,3-diacylglucosamine diphosphatase n=1 Tax=Magnetovirga frankeli TaxID=947516 RepID=UPI0012934ACD|nr:UDP-2,3-diacylglucosamine diphosphatase [gamma proteobacterium SS-5]
MGERLFIADLHLSAQRPEVTRLFRAFIQRRAPAAQALYILGDLFDIWIGDDALDAFGREIADLLRGLTAQGSALYLQHGNRDFLLGEDFCARSGAHLLNEEQGLELPTGRCLLMHGDLLCSDDEDYQRARALLHSPEFIADFLAKPPRQRLQLAQEYRRRSGEATSLKAQDIMDVNPETLLRYMQRHQAQSLIHGHTHRPGLHELGGSAEGKRRIVLGDWRPEGAVCLSLQADQGFRLFDFRP